MALLKRLTVASLTSENDRPAETVRAIIKLVSESETPIIEQVLVRQREIRQLRNDINQMGNPKAIRSC